MWVMPSGWKMRVRTKSSHDMPDVCVTASPAAMNMMLWYWYDAAERLRQREHAHAAHDVLARERRVVPQLVVAREAGAMRDDVAQRDLRVRAHVGEAEVGDVLAHRIVEGELPVARQHRQRRARERLRRRRDLEQRVRRDRHSSPSFVP